MAVTAPSPSPSRRRLGVGADHPHYKWWALSCTSLGMLLATVNSGTLIIALPTLERALGTTLFQLVWVILAYMIASTVLVLSLGRVSDLVGRKVGYVVGFAVFSVASLGAGFAGGGTELIGWRILQGVGGAFLFANSTALVADAFPRRQLAFALGTSTMVAAVGLVLGPVLGGLLVEVGWRWVFWFNVPFGVLGTVWGLLILREAPRGRAAGRALGDLDLPGTLVLVASLTGIVFGVSRGALSGWTSLLTEGPLVAGVILLGAFVAIEHRVAAPTLDLDIFRSRTFSTATGAAFLSGLSRSAITFLFVFYYQGAQGDDPVVAGIKLAPMALGMLVASPLAGIVADHRHGRLLAPGGLLISAAALVGMTALGVHTAYWVSGLWLAVVGAGFGLFNSPNAAAIMGSVTPERRGVASGARMMVQNAGGVLSIAIILAIITAAVPKDVLFSIFSGLTDKVDDAALVPFIENLHIAFWVMAAVSLAAAGVSALRPREDAPGHRGEALPDAFVAVEEQGL